ncbi:MAG: hypothetical protein AAF694_01025 [Bacteroidota bacterium]
MKTFFLLILSALIWVSPAHASEPPPADKPLTVYDQVRKYVSFNRFCKENQLQGTVHLKFYLDEIHTIHITSLSGTHKELKAWVKSKLVSREIYGQNIKVGKTYELTFSYSCPQMIGRSPVSRAGHLGKR